MTHLHIPDGVLPPWLWIGGYIVVVLLVGYFSKKVKKLPPNIYRKKLVHAGIISAIITLAMSVEIFVYHPNFTVISGIILGADYSIFASLIVNIILSLFGHGGVTTLGLNTLVVFSQMLLGVMIFKMTAGIFKGDIFWRVFVSTFLGLFISSLFAIFIIEIGSTAWQLEGKAFTALALGVSFLGIMLESFMSAVAASYIQSVRPDLLGETSDKKAEK
jgi:cobalt/nickel transport system permease protein